MKTIEITRNGMKLHTISIEDDCQIRINDVEAAQKYTPKKGDCVKSVNIMNKNVCFISNGNGGSMGVYLDNCDYNNPIKVFGKTIINNQTQITPEELQAEFEKAGYVYDFETHTAKKLRWKPKVNEAYFVVGFDGIVFSARWNDDGSDNAYHSMKNCHKTKEAAEKFRSYMRAYEV